MMSLKELFNTVTKTYATTEPEFLGEPCANYFYNVGAVLECTDIEVPEGASTSEVAVVLEEVYFNEVQGPLNEMGVDLVIMHDAHGNVWFQTKSEDTSVEQATELNGCMEAFLAIAEEAFAEPK